MRPKIVLGILLAGAAGLAIILFLKPWNKAPQPTPPVSTPPAVVQQEAQAVLPQATTPASNATVAAPVQPAKRIPFTTPEVVGENAEYLQATINRLEDLMMNDDDASLQAILKELTNTNAIIRHEAIEATIQFGGHTSVPVLQDLATRTWDPKEKQELLDAAEFLALPTWSEVRAQQQQEKLQTPDTEQP